MGEQMCTVRPGSHADPAPGQVLQPRDGAAKRAARRTRHSRREAGGGGLKPRLVFAVAVLMMAAPASAQGQPGARAPTGSLIPRRVAEVYGETKLAARLSLRQFGVCVVKRRMKGALSLIDMPVDSAQYRKAISDIVSDECLASGELTFPYDLLRGQIFETLYLDQLDRFRKPDFTGVPSFNYAKAYSRPLTETAQNIIGLGVVGDCVARTVPMEAHNFLRSFPGTKLEDQALAAVVKQLPGCLPPRQTFRFSRSIIRGAVAEAIYRLSSQQVGVGR